MSLIQILCQYFFCPAIACLLCTSAAYDNQMNSMMLTMEANTMNPDQTAPKGSILFAGGSELEWLT